MLLKLGSNQIGLSTTFKKMIKKLNKSERLILIQKIEAELIKRDLQKTN